MRTDQELAARLGITKQTISGYRNGARLPDAVVCATIAGLSGMPLAQVIGIVGEQRAISREEKAVWRKLAATATLLLVGFLGGFSHDAHAKSEPVFANQTIHYAKFHSRAAVLLGYYGRLLRLVIAAVDLPHLRPANASVGSNKCPRFIEGPKTSPVLDEPPNKSPQTYVRPVVAPAGPGYD